MKVSTMIPILQIRNQRLREMRKPYCPASTEHSAQHGGRVQGNLLSQCRHHTAGSGKLGSEFRANQACNVTPTSLFDWEADTEAGNCQGTKELLFTLQCALPFLEGLV